MQLSTIKSKYSFLHIIVIIGLLFTAAFTVGEFFRWYPMSREDGYDILKVTFSNYVQLQGVGIAILAILLAVIQLAYKQLSIITLLIEETYFIPVFYFGMVNIGICGLLMNFHAGNKPFTDFQFVRLSITEEYLFALSVPAWCFAFFSTVRLTNFALISEIYMEKVYRFAETEKKGNTTDRFRQQMQSYGFEIKAEVDSLIDQNKAILLNRFFDFYVRVLQLNHNSNLLEGIHFSLRNWFIKSYKNPDKDAFDIIVTAWWKLFKNSVPHFDPDKTNFLSDLPLLIYKRYQQTKDVEIRDIAIQIFPRRLREQALILIYENDEKKTFTDITVSQIDSTLKVYAVFFKAMLEENDTIGFDVLMNQVTQFNNTLQNRIGELRTAQMRDPSSVIASNVLTLQNLYLLENHQFLLLFRIYSWIVFKVRAGEYAIADYSKFLETIAAKIYNIAPLLISNVLTEILVHDTQLSLWIQENIMKEEGEVYSIESDQVVRSISFILLTQGFPFGTITLLEKVYQNASQIIPFVTAASNEFRRLINNLKDLFGHVIKLGFDQHLLNVDSLVAELKDRLKAIQVSSLLTQPLSDERVKDFQNRIRNQWQVGRTLSQVFEFFKAIEIDPPEKLKWAGPHQIYFKGAKVMFVEKNYQHIHGIEWGNTVNDSVCELFIHTISQNPAVIQIQSSGYIQAFNHIINEHGTINIAFISLSSYVSANKDLMQSGNYTDYSKSVNTAYPFKAAGLYRDKLLIIPIRNRTFTKQVVGVNIPESVILRRRENTEWIDNKLQVVVTEITDVNAAEIISKNNPGLDINDPTVIEEAKTGVLIEIDETLDFKILNSAGIVVATVNKNAP